MDICKECGRKKDVDWVGWCDDCLEKMDKWVKETEGENP